MHHHEVRRPRLDDGLPQQHELRGAAAARKVVGIAAQVDEQRTRRERLAADEACWRALACDEAAT